MLRSSEEGLAGAGGASQYRALSSQAAVLHPRSVAGGRDALLLDHHLAFHIGVAN